MSSTDAAELAALLAQDPEVKQLSEASRAWCADAAVCQRYLDCGSKNGAPGPARTLPFMRSTAVWRDAMRVDEMLRSEEECAFEVKLRQLLLYDIRSDHLRRPMMIEHVGRWDVSALRAACEATPDEILRAHVLVNERIRLQVDGASGRGLSERGAVLIFDCEGVGIAHVRAAASLGSLFSAMSRLDAEHFPETVGHIFVVNTSRVFTALWAAVSPFVATGTRAKVHVFSWANAQAMSAALREACGADSLPVELGGELVGARPYNWPERSE